MTKKALKAVFTQAPIKLDIGCGKQKKPGFFGVDQYAYDGVDKVVNLREPWPWGDDSVDEIHASHILEHFGGRERVHIFNEMYRVMQKGAKALIITPYWASNRAYGDYTHEWPPVTEMLYNYLWKEWRLNNAAHNDVSVNPEGYSCDFDFTYFYNMHPLIAAKNQEAQMYALSFYKEAAQDLVCTLIKAR